MALATKDYIAEREDVLREARQAVAEISEPIRAEASACLELDIEAFGDPTEDKVTSGKFRTVIFAAIPLDLDDLASGDYPLTNEEIGQNICTLALEVRALKETVEKQGLLIEQLNNMLRFVGSQFIVGLPGSPLGSEGRRAMTYQPTENDLLMDTLMERVRALDPTLAGELSDARCNEISEAEDRAVLTHGRQILAVIEGRGFAGEGSVWRYEDDSTWARVLDGTVAQ
jgi:hypothetical protein